MYQELDSLGRDTNSEREFQNPGLFVAREANRIVQGWRGLAGVRGKNEDGNRASEDRSKECDSCTAALFHMFNSDSLA